MKKINVKVLYKETMRGERKQFDSLNEALELANKILKDLNENYQFNAEYDNEEKKSFLYHYGNNVLIFVDESEVE
jgi:predicted transcriptional regulator